MTVGMENLRLVDERFGDGPRYYLFETKDIDMRVPDQIKKCVLFVGLPEMPEPEYRGTAFIVTVPGTQSNHFAFTVTARHVAERLQGKDYYIRANKKDGTAIALQGRASDPWWFHPSEREHVDAAVTLFSPMRLAELDVEHIPLGMFADPEIIAKRDIGIGDEVFITGLFTKVTETMKNIPILRTGAVAMIPGERIPFGDKLIEAYLIEARSIGGLSGSPVFVRETVQIPHQLFPKAGMIVPLFGMGPIWFFGSVIGHWDLPSGFTTTEAEAVNMGISPIVPAHKIREIILQPELVEMMKKVNDEMRTKNQTGAKLDLTESKEEPFTQDDFETALRKASRKVAPESKK